MQAPTKTNWILIFALLTAGLFAAAQFGKLTLTLPILQQTYLEGGALVPALVSIVGVVGIVLGAVAGSVVARIGVTRALISALWAGAVFSLLQASLPNIWVFAGLRVLEGLSHLAIVVAAPTLIASVASETDRPLAMGIWAAFFGISMAIISVLLPVLLPLGGLPVVFVAHGVGMGVMALVLWPILPRGQKTELRQISYLEEHRIIYTTPRLLIPGAGFVFYTILYIALLALLPLAYGLPTGAMTALLLTSIIGTLFGGFVAKRLSPIRVVTLGFVLTVLTCALTWGLSPAYWPLYPLFFVMALIPAGSFAAIPNYNDSVTDRARATGGIAQLGNVGTTLGTPIFVLVFQLGGLGAVCLLLALFCGFGIAVTRLLKAKIK